MKKLLAFFTYIFVSLHILAQQEVMPFSVYNDVKPPKYEVRAAWVATIGGIDWPHSYAQNTERSINKQKKELTDILDKLQQAGINTVLLQTRVRATTIYPSQYEPWDGCLSGRPGVSPGYDALAFAIEECHKRGIELHAWVVSIPVGKWNGTGCKNLRKRYPKLIKKIGDDGYMNPEDPKTGDVIADLCDEIVENYDIDGIQLDYIRYPEDWNITVKKSKGREYITNIVRKVSNRVKARKPWVKMSCSPVGKYDDLPRQSSRGWNANSRVCQDAQGWLKDGLMDMLFPMMYFKGDNFFPFLYDWKQRSYGRVVVPGLGIYFLSPKEKNWPLTTITQEMEVARQLGVGHCMYRSKFFTDNTKGLYDYTKQFFNTTQALSNPMTWLCNICPEAPAELSVDSISNTLSWSGAINTNNSPYLLYNIYGSREWPVDIDDANNLMKTRYKNTSLSVPLNGYYYAVTAMDRYGNESKALQMACPYPSYTIELLAPTTAGQTIFPCDGNNLSISSEVRKTDVIEIETLQGKTISTNIGKNQIDVRHIKEGVYQVRQIGKNKVNRRLGYFYIYPRKNT